MTADSFAHLEGTEMDRPATDAFLAEQGVGLLALTDGAEAYGLPVSCGYDGAATLYFVFLRLGEHSKKRAVRPPDRPGESHRVRGVEQTHLA